MPKLIIKREVSKRFTRQAILFWVLGLLPVALLAGFLTGNLISQLRHTSLKAGATPMLPLASPKHPALELPNSQAPSSLPLPAASELPNDSVNTKPANLNHEDVLNTKPANASDRDSSSNKQTTQQNTAANQHQPEQAKTKHLIKEEVKATKPEAIKKPSTEPVTQLNKPNPVINRADTSDQQNNRSRPIRTPSSTHKPVKSPQRVSESPRSAARPVISTRSVTRSRAEANTNKLASSPTTVRQQEGGSNDDYRLLEQSLGIPLQ